MTADGLTRALDYEYDIWRRLLFRQPEFRGAHREPKRIAISYFIVGNSITQSSQGLFTNSVQRLLRYSLRFHFCRCYGCELLFHISFSQIAWISMNLLEPHSPSATRLASSFSFSQTPLSFTPLYHHEMELYTLLSIAGNAPAALWTATNYELLFDDVCASAFQKIIYISFMRRGAREQLHALFKILLTCKIRRFSRYGAFVCYFSWPIWSTIR